jgi:hypothetical protein
MTLPTRCDWRLRHAYAAVTLAQHLTLNSV